MDEEIELEKSIEMTKWYFIGTCAAIAIAGIGIGVLGSMFFILSPLTEKYNEKYAQISENGKLVCFDVSKLTNKTNSTASDFLIFPRFATLNFCDKAQMENLCTFQAFQPTFKSDIDVGLLQAQLNRSAKP